MASVRPMSVLEISDAERPVLESLARRRKASQASGSLVGCPCSSREKRVWPWRGNMIGAAVRRQNVRGYDFPSPIDPQAPNTAKDELRP
jgi:hypothetical protein